MLCIKNKPDFFINVFKSLCKNNDTDTVDKIINYGIDMNTKNICDNTPIHIACEYSPEIAIILIHKGTQLNTKNRFNKRPIDYCKKNSDVYNLLIKHGVKP